MDIGDKPDPTSPAAWVSEETLAGWEAIFGPTWLSFDAHGLHGVLLNSNIMGGPLPQAEAQRRWLEADLEAHQGRRIVLFLHHPPFFVDPAERSWGMYNSLDEPARGWLLGLIRRYGVELLFAGHTHFVSLNRLDGDGARLFAAPSTTTSRAGLPEAFTVLPEDRGRSDLPKLGFYLVRDTGAGAGAGRAGPARGPSVALIRTALDSPALDPADPRRRLLTPPSADLPASRLGVVATHPLGHATPGPVVWPSVVRQPVRDDWRVLALTELGARRVRVPESDLDDPLQRERLPVLRGEGVDVVASWLWSPRVDVPAAVAAHRDVLDEAEVVFPGDALPHPDCLAQITALRGRGMPVALSVVQRATPVPPQYHGRTRSGFLVEELAGLDAWLGRHACRVDRVSCRVPEGARAWDVAGALRALGPLANAGAVDLLLDLPFQDDVRPRGGRGGGPVRHGGAPRRPGSGWPRWSTSTAAWTSPWACSTGSPTPARPSTRRARSTPSSTPGSLPGPKPSPPPPGGRGKAGACSACVATGGASGSPSPRAPARRRPIRREWRSPRTRRLVCYDLVAGTSEALPGGRRRGPARAGAGVRAGAARGAGVRTGGHQGILTRGEAKRRHGHGRTAAHRSGRHRRRQHRGGLPAGGGRAGERLPPAGALRARGGRPGAHRAPLRRAVDDPDYGELLARPDVDAVAIYSPDALHFPMIRDALLAGKDVLVTKSRWSSPATRRRRCWTWSGAPGARCWWARPRATTPAPWRRAGWSMTATWGA